MTPQLEEALRLLRLAERDSDVFKIIAGYGDNVYAAAGSPQELEQRFSGVCQSAMQNAN